MHMRNGFLSVAVAGLILASCGRSDDETTASTTSPTPKNDAAAMTGMTGPTPGLWRVTTVMEGMPAMGGAMPAVETCIGRTTFEEMQAQGRAAAGSDTSCSEQTFRREGSGFVGRSVCTGPDARRTVIDTRVSGDFSRRYVMEMRSETTPPPAPGMAATTMTMTAERVGDC